MRNLFHAIAYWHRPAFVLMEHVGNVGHFQCLTCGREQLKFVDGW